MQSSYISAKYPAHRKYHRPHDLLDRPDAIVIGSGIGGLGVASLLAQRRGMRVLVLEANSVPGGSTHCHEIDGFEFNSGIHSIGDMAEGGILRDLIDYVTQGQLAWQRMPEVHEICTFGEETYEWHSSPEANAEWIRARLPGEGDPMPYYRLEERIHKACAGYGVTKLLPEWMPVALREGIYRATAAPWRKYLHKSALEVMRKELGFSERLAAIFSYMYGNYGMTPSRVPFSLHAIVLNHYRMGAYYPIGGPAQFAASIIPVIENAGGQVAVSTAVERIVIENDRAVGVRLKNGGEIRAPLVISDASAYNTFAELLPPETYERSGYKQKLAGVQPSPPHYVLMLGYDKHIDLPPHVIWHMPQASGVGRYDIDGADALFRGSYRAEAMAGYVISPSARDAAWRERYPNKSTVVALCEMPWLAEWQRDPSRAKELDLALGRELLALVHRYMPQLAKETPVISVGRSPVGCHPTSWNGSSYGLAVTPERYLRDTHWLRPRTKIRGLYLTGQDALSPGFAGALTGASVAYSAITADVLPLVRGFGPPMRPALPAPVAAERDVEAA